MTKLCKGVKQLDEINRENMDGIHDMRRIHI